jgi:ribonuclease VapC
VILDSSAVIAILRQEPEAGRFAKAIESAPACRISAVSFVETAAVIDSEKNPVASRRLDDLLQRAEVEIMPVTPEQARLAREAYRHFGRGSGHPAKLNLGDCFTYALAASAGEPLLCKGDEFLKAGLTLAQRQE